MMRWFGSNPYPFDASDLEQETPSPVGQACTWCGESIDAKDSGFVVDGLSRELKPERLPYHFECQARAIIGSLAHLQRRCSCYVPGATCTDPPELTRREAARAALKFFRSQPQLPGAN